MKKTILTIATALVMTLSSFASSSINPLKIKDAKEILLTYVDATSIGNTNLNKFLFTEDFQYENTTNNDKYNKKVYMAFLKENKGLKYNCSTKYEILDQSNDSAVAKSTMTFENFKRVDHITLVHTNDGWKISRVITSYM